MRIDRVYLSRYSPGKNVYAIHNGRKITHPYHMNDCMMAAYIAHGCGTLTVDEKTINIEEGDVILMNENVPYLAVPHRGGRNIDIYFCFFDRRFGAGVFGSEYAEQFSGLASFFNREIPYIRAVDTAQKEMRDIFVRMIDEQLSALPCGYEAMAGYLMVLLTKMLRCAKPSGFKRIYSSNGLVDESIRYIHEHMYSRVSLKDIAEHLRVSPSFLCRLFKEHTGMTTSQYINLLRVKKIKDVLKNTGRPLNMVSEMFSCNIEYLKRVFKRETGMTMNEYREKYNYKTRN